MSRKCRRFRPHARLKPRPARLATYSEGFRVGGLNDVSFGTNVPRSFAPDELTNYEAGFKTSWNSRFRINGAAFFIDWDKIQIGTRDSSSGVPFITNSGDARIVGAEIDLTALLSDGIRLELGGSYTDAELTSDQPPVDPGEDRGQDGDRFPNVARTNVHASFVYNRGLAIGNLTLRADLMSRGSTDIRFDDDPFFNHDLESFSLINLSASIETDGGWTGRLFINNATDERTEFDAISSFQDPLAIVGGRPRTAGISVRKASEDACSETA